MMSSNKKLRVVLVGCGGISNGWVRATGKFDDIKIVGLVDLDVEKAKNMREKHELTDAVTGDDLNQLLDDTQPDAVFDCTVPDAHCEVTLTALNKGCHVIGEKPMSTNMEDARQMVAAAERNKRIYAVIQNRRYLNSIVRYRDLVQKSGGIGDLTTLNADFYMAPRFGGFRDEMKHVLLKDMAIHSFDQARFISGADAESVYCHEWNPKGSWYAHGASGVTIFEMSNGLVFTYRGSWCAQGLPTSWECEWRAIGTDGTAKWDGNEQVDCEAVCTGDNVSFETEKRASVAPEDLPYLGHGALIREFADCIQSGGTPQTICTDNIKSLAMVEAAVQSAETGKKVKVEV